MGFVLSLKAIGFVVPVPIFNLILIVFCVPIQAALLSQSSQSIIN